MEKIKFIVDTPSDIPDADLKRYNIDMLHVPIAVDGIEYIERQSFGIIDFYEILENAKELPVTSRIPPEEYLAAYTRAYQQGYTTVINVTINAKGSGIYDSACLATTAFFDQFPVARDAFHIHTIDSRTYSLAYGYAVLQAAQMAQQGQPSSAILEYLDDWFSSVVILLGCYSLKYAKRSGRIGAASAVIGDALGIRPIIAMIDGSTKTVQKVRGDLNLVPQMFEQYLATRVDPRDPVLSVGGSETAPIEELAQLLKKELKRDIPMYHIGAAVTINTGPRVIAIACKGKKRT